MRKNSHKNKVSLSAQYLADGILNKNKILLSKTITLLESSKEKDIKIAREVIKKVLPSAKKSFRIGITGVPGVGKSTFIEAIGKYILEDNHNIAVLAIDPSSQKSKGSILGDKTRMEHLSSQENVFIRPSPTNTALGGVGRRTRETILLCEACGFDIIFVETVGVGQSEIAVHSMVDCLLLLMLATAGDELQGIKRGIMEMADFIAINKALGKDDIQANKAIKTYKNAIHHFPKSKDSFQTEVVSCSAYEDYNIKYIWNLLKKYQQHQKETNLFNKRRNKQTEFWLHETIKNKLNNLFYNNKIIKEKLSENNIHKEDNPFLLADELINTFLNYERNKETDS